MLRIGSLELSNPVILAPMAGVTDPPFRKIVGRYRPGLICGEMVSAMALHYNSKKTRELIGIDPTVRPVSIQIFGSEPEVMAEAARTIEEAGADLIDINMGCPVPKVVKNGEGAALLKNLPLARDIIKAVVEAVSIPVTLKCRLGWDRDHIVAPELAELAESLGVAAVAVHARTREQYYHGRADWDQIKAVKQRVAIPVIGNGDIDSPQAATAIMEQTHCDGVMIGQAAMGRPWLFGQVRAYLEKGILIPEPSLKEQFGIIREHLALQVAYSGEERGVKEMRKHLGWYFKGLPGASRVRDQVNHVSRAADLELILKEYEASLESKAL
ncbi:MAG: tRNA dihydrouridine synthase DusB [Firmicutes bacterium]|nr:tRNA dihydrouridine synthase DusB [Bacillota bacterium]